MWCSDWYNICINCLTRYLRHWLCLSVCCRLLASNVPILIVHNFECHSPPQLKLGKIGLKIERKNGQDGNELKLSKCTKSWNALQIHCVRTLINVLYWLQECYHRTARHMKAPASTHSINTHMCSRCEQIILLCTLTLFLSLQKVNNSFSLIGWQMICSRLLHFVQYAHWFCTSILSQHGNYISHLM